MFHQPVFELVDETRSRRFRSPGTMRALMGFVNSLVRQRNPEDSAGATPA